MLTRLRGDIESTLEVLGRAGAITAEAQVPASVLRSYTLEHASVLAELGETERAGSLLSRFSQLDSALAKARLDVLRFTGDSAQPVDYTELQAVLERSPFVFSIPLAIALARAYLRADRPELAHDVLAARARWFTRHYPLLPDTLEARLTFGWVLHDLDRYDEADLEFRAVRTAHPNAWASAWAAVGSASVARALGRRVEQTTLSEAHASLLEAPAGWDFERRRATELVTAAP